MIKNQTPIILIHGLIGCLNDPEIIGSIDLPQVWAPDLLGYGKLSSIRPKQITLSAQVLHLHSWISNKIEVPVHLIGHSVGAVVAALFASEFPKLVASLTSVEGNFTLADAFWSAKVAKMSSEESEEMMEIFRSDVAAWLGRSGVQPDMRTLALGKRWLENQPASTVLATAKDVIAVTGEDSYLSIIKRVINSGLSFHLIAGERSLKGWSIPDWVRESATSLTILTGVGHMMMIEDPKSFGLAIKNILIGSGAH